VELRNEEELLAGAEDPGAFYQQILQPYKLQCYERYVEERTARSDLNILVHTMMSVLRPAQTPPPSIEELRARVEQSHGTEV
ncbi:MAG: hypothetical protein WBP67_16890, partial [Thermoanaerobaculia bacterium]